MMADAARYNVDHGAQIIDINMGCPAKKVCNVIAGSALLRDEPLVARILDAVVNAVDVPVTLKIRTGWDRQTGTRCASRTLPNRAGIRLLAIHGRTRACGLRRQRRVRHDPRGEGGDPPAGDRQRRHRHAGGREAGARLHRRRRRDDRARRAGRGRGSSARSNTSSRPAGELPPPRVAEIRDVLLAHLQELYAFYGAEAGVRVARKHVAWYTKGLAGSAQFREALNRIETCEEQLAAVDGATSDELAQESNNAALR